MRADIDGSNITTIFESQTFLLELVLDVKLQYIYFNNRTTGNIARITYQGTDYEEIHNGSGVIGAMTIDFVQGKLYWVERDNYSIIRADISGENIEELIHYPYPPLTQISGLDIGTEDITSLETNDNDCQINFYLNPCKTKLHIKANSTCDITIYDITGKITLKILNSNSDIIDLNSLKRGIYIIKITTKASSLTKKLIIE